MNIIICSELSQASFCEKKNKTNKQKNIGDVISIIYRKNNFVFLGKHYPC